MRAQCINKTYSFVIKTSNKKHYTIVKNSDKQDEYKYKFKSFSENETIPKMLSKRTIKSISLKNLEPLWITKFRIKSFKFLYLMNYPMWSESNYIFKKQENIVYYSAVLQKSSNLKKMMLEPNKTESKGALKNTAIDVVLDSISVATSYQKELNKHGILFSNFFDSIKKYPDLISTFLGSVVSIRDNYFTCLNSAVFSEGSFVYVPKNTTSPMDLSTYFRINGNITGQFERTLIITEPSSRVSYLEGCTAPFYSKAQLHAAVVELLAFEQSNIKYSTVQNWYPGDSKGSGGILNYVTKRGLCLGDRSKISWTQVETGSSYTWKYPSVVLKGDKSIGEFYSIAITKLLQKADTGTKMIHIGSNTKSKIISKGISLGNSRNCYRGLVLIHNNSNKSINNTQCDSIIVGSSSSANTYPYIMIREPSSSIEHEATIAKIKDEQLFYIQQRCIDVEEAISLIVSGFCKEVIEELPFEFLSEVNELLNSSFVTKIG
uniref:Chloroplast iron sulfur assembly protein SufB n=1 Tax=Gymnochlora stellata TaxID=67809 RepID=B5A4F7_GYMST|nr:chloroplast iron sulfur assembly protein SufB [Gymnochlora stellata]